MRKRIVYLILAIFLGLFNNVTAITSIAGNKPLLPLHVDGKWLVNSDGKKVVLHGVMDTPNMYFNNNRWTGGYTESGASNCLTFFEKLYGGLEQANCDVFRLHLDPVWTNDPNKTSDGKENGEADISRFSSARLQSFLNSLFIPLMEKAMNHGMYVVVRPPGICPTNLQVGDYYQDYLLTVWDIVSKNATIKGYSGQISFELANEPVHMKDANGNNNTSASHDYFQPIVNKIRENGFDGIIWVPGIGWQTDCKNYSTYPITGTNIGYAVHDYPGYFGCSDSNPDAQNKIKAFQTSVPMVTSAPILISEVDWSPENPNSAGHYNESGQLVKDNYGTWGTAATSKWGNAFKAMLDHFGNISMTLSGSYCLIDLDELFDNNKVTAAFDGNMEACGGACMKWYADYAQDNNTSEDIITFADANVKAICIANWDTNGDGVLSKEEAAAVKDLGTVFKEQDIKSFNELQFFTGLTSIAHEAFSYCRNLTTIVLPNGLTNINSWAFGHCEALSSINIPENVTSIGQSAFFSCNQLTSIALPKGVTSINSQLFSYCSGLTSFTIPENVTEIGSYAFNECRSLAAITIPKNVSSIEQGVFSNCTDLSSITVDISNSVYDSRNNSNAIIETSSNTLISGCKNTVIPSSVINLAASVFEGCGLTSISIPKSVISIDKEAFLYCPDLTSIVVDSNNPVYDSRNNCNAIINSNTNKLCLGCKNTVIPKEVTVIGENAFHGCHDITSITIPDNVTSIESSAFFDCMNLTSITLPNGVTSIGDEAFSGCINLKSFTFPNSVVSIGNWAFSNCGLTSFKIPESVVRIGRNAFYYTPWLEAQPDGVLYVGQFAYGYKGTMPPNTSITIKEGTKRLVEYAFSGCKDLISITLPESLESISYGAFYGCHNLTSVTSSIITPFTIDGNVFEGINNDCVLHVPAGTKSLYEQTDGWRGHFSQIMEPFSEGSTFIAKTAEGVDMTFKVISNNEMTCMVGDERGEGIDAISNDYRGAITIPTTVNGYTVTRIGSWAFSSCGELSAVTIPNTVTSVGTQAFNFTALSSITLPNSLTTLEGFVFQGCSGLTSMTIPKSVTRISDGLFQCPNINRIVVEDGNPVYDSRNNCNAIIETATNTLIAGCNTTVIPDGVTTLALHAFVGCEGLKEIAIPGSVKKIEFRAFAGCSNLTSVTSNIMTPFTIEDNVFEGINESCVLYVPIGTQSLYEQTEGWNEHFGKILEKPLTIFATNMSREYGEANPTWAFTSTGGVPNGTPAFSCEATETSPVGTYDIIVSQGSVTNTNVTYVKGKLTITKAPLKVTVKDCSKYEEEENPTFELIYSGFKNGETEEVVTQKPTAMCTADIDSKVGTYIITVSGGEAPNYTLNYESGILTVKEPPMDLFEVDNMTFQLARQSPEKGVAFVKAPEASEFIVPEKTIYNGATCPVTVIADEAFVNRRQLKSVTIPASITKSVGKNLFSNCPRLASIVWETPCELTNETLGKITNPNLLLYVTNVSSAPEGITNIINLQTKQAEQMVLVDDADFYCPTDFKVGEITYTHTFNQRTEQGACRGWETLVLPFDVTEITHEANGAITPFGALDRGYEYVNNTRPFWLYQYSSKGFMEAESVRANVPYLISMPNEARLGREYIQKGKVTFKATNATVKATSTAKSVKSGNCSFTPNYQQAEMPTAYLLNVGEVYDVHPEGSIFVKNHRSARPFEAYFEVEGSAGVKPYFGVFEHLTDGIRSIAPAMRDGDTEYYQLDGTKRTSPQRGFNIVRTKKGEVHKALIK